MGAVHVDVYSDVVCPWCYIGEHRLEEAIGALGGGVAVTRSLRPFLLDPTTPEAGVDLREHLRRKYGGNPDQMFKRVEDVARADGLEMDFGRVRTTCATTAAHTLLRHAEARGTQLALGRALFRAYFVEGRNLALEEVLAPLAAQHGFTAAEASALIADPDERAATRTAAAEAARRGIRGVPFFVFNGRLAVSGAQPIEVLRGAIEAAARDEGSAG